MSQDDYLIYGFHEVPKGLVLVVEWLSHIIVGGREMLGLTISGGWHRHHGI